MMFHAINLAILLFIIIKFGGPQVSAALQVRSDEVSKDIVEAKALFDEAEVMLAEIDARVAGFEAQAEGLLADYTSLGEAERDRIIAEATAEAERIRSEAHLVAENEATRARAALESEIVDKAVQAAEAIIQEQLTTDDHHRLVTDYFGQLEADIKA
jgi:F-type H+-transporting ATPase subunit b